MGKRGPKPTPTVLLTLRGSTVPGRRGAGDEPVAAGLPDAPEWLSDDAAAIWDGLLPVLAEMDILGRCDAAALAQYCDAMARFIVVQAWLTAHGDTYSTTDEGGNVRWQNYPQVQQYHKLAEMTRRLEAEFGMTPSARTSVKVNKPPADGGLMSRKRA